MCAVGRNTVQIHPAPRALGLGFCILSEPGVIKNEGGDPCSAGLTGLTWGGVKSRVHSASETGKQLRMSSEGKWIIFQSSLSLAVVLPPASPLLLCSLHVPFTSLFFTTCSLLCSQISALCSSSAPQIREYKWGKTYYYLSKSQQNALFSFSLLVSSI